MNGKLFFSLLFLISIIFVKSVSCQQTNCQFSSQCPLNQPICSANNSCVFCVNSSQCDDRDFNHPICDNGTCRNCTNSSECNYNPSYPICYWGICYSCQTSEECYLKDPSFPICIQANGSCQHCIDSSECAQEFGSDVVCDTDSNSPSFGSCVLPDRSPATRYMASLILVIVVSGTVVVFGLVVLIVILVLNRKYKHSRHNVQQNRFQNSPVTFPTQFQMHTISSPVVNQQSSPSANAAPLKRNLPIPAESEEASEEESQEDEENKVSSHENVEEGQEVQESVDVTDSFDDSKRATTGRVTATQSNKKLPSNAGENGNESDEREESDNSSNEKEVDSVNEDEDDNNRDREAEEQDSVNEDDDG